MATPPLRRVEVLKRQLTGTLRDFNNSTSLLPTRTLELEPSAGSIEPSTRGGEADIEELCVPTSRKGSCGLSCDTCGAAAECAEAHAESEVRSSVLPTFDTPGLSLRAKSRLAGPNGNHWYPACVESDLLPGTVQGIVFWKSHIAVWRTETGKVYACEDRCAHRQLRLSKGLITGENLTCCYHGWEYDGAGRVVKVAHELPASFRDKGVPKIEIRTYPIRAKYGILFFFPGDPALADTVPLPTIPWLDTANPIPFKHIDFTVNCHFSMVIENNCDFYHAFLHRKYAPFKWPELQSVESNGDAVKVVYKTDMGESFFSKNFGKTQSSEGKNLMKLWYDYPVQRSNLEDKYFHWMFACPISERESRTFYIFLWEAMEFAGMNLPYSIRPPLIWGVHRFYLRPVLAQDLYALEEEQAMNDIHMDKNSVELNPLVSAFQKLSVRKWSEYIESEKARRGRVTARQWRGSFGAGLSDYKWAMYK